MAKYAERRTVPEDDWRCLAGWYRKLARDPENAPRCENNIDDEALLRRRPGKDG